MKYVVYALSFIIITMFIIPLDYLVIKDKEILNVSAKIISNQIIYDSKLERYNINLKLQYEDSESWLLDSCQVVKEQLAFYQVGKTINLHMIIYSIGFKPLSIYRTVLIII